MLILEAKWCHLYKKCLISGKKNPSDPMLATLPTQKQKEAECNSLTFSFIEWVSFMWTCPLRPSHWDLAQHFSAEPADASGEIMIFLGYEKSLKHAPKHMCAENTCFHKEQQWPMSSGQPLNPGFTQFNRYFNLKLSMKIADQHQTSICSFLKIPLVAGWLTLKLVHHPSWESLAHI